MNHQTLLPYTLCFCKFDDQILMLYRHKNPNQYKWNGVGGKINLGESPAQANLREVWEETGIDLKMADQIRFGGVVCWDVTEGETIRKGGMYVYIADLNPRFKPSQKVSTEEGILECKDLNWILKNPRKQVVDNIPIFLQPMLIRSDLSEYKFIYNSGKLIGHQIFTL